MCEERVEREESERTEGLKDWWIDDGGDVLYNND